MVLEIIIFKHKSLIILRYKSSCSNFGSFEIFMNNKFSVFYNLKKNDLRLSYLAYAAEREIWHMLQREKKYF